MKILVLNYEFPPLGGGASPVSRDLAVQLCKKGHEVTVITMGFRGLPIYEQVEKVKIYRLKCWRSKKSSCMPWEQFTYLFAIRKFMKKHMKNNSYDVCHTHFIIPTGEAAEWVKRKFGIPYVITAHGSDVEGYNQKVYIKAMHKILRHPWRRIVQQSESAIAPSYYLLELMQKEYFNGKYILVPNGLDIQRYRHMSHNKKKEKRILLMGRMQKSKNMQTILKALALVDLQEWKVDILGDGPYRQELEILAMNLNISHKVVFHGWIDNNSEEQLNYLQRASIYITASHFENCPMAVLETVAAGCYPLLSDIPGHRQMVPDDKYYFAMDDEYALANKLSELLITKADLHCEIDISQYDWENVIKRYEEILVKAYKNTK